MKDSKTIRELKKYKKMWEELKGFIERHGPHGYKILSKYIQELEKKNK